MEGDDLNGEFNGPGGSARGIDRALSVNGDDPEKRPLSTVGAWLAEGRRRLVGARTPNDRAPVDARPREAVLLLGEVLGWTEPQVRARDDRPISAAAVAVYEDLLRRRMTGEPVAYLLGRREFYGREMLVDRRVLIPRPETEHLIDAALKRLPGDRALRLLDVGTGSGCIAVTLACELPQARCWAVDASLPALEVARANGRKHRVDDRMQVLAGGLAAACDLRQVDMMVANLPYVAPEAAVDMSPEVLDFEPHSALFAEDRGRRLIAELLDACEGLRPGVPAMLEIGYDQGCWLREEVESRPFLAWEELIHDYAGHPRLGVFRRA